MPTPSAIDLLLANLDYAFDKTAWHGPNLAASVRGVRVADAARSVAARKSIWEQTLHAAYWKQRVLNKLIGTQKFPRRGSNWPPMPEPRERTEVAWRADARLLHEIHGKLRGAVASLNPAQLRDEKIVRLILGAAAHDLYHAGQIRLLRRMLT